MAIRIDTRIDHHTDPRRHFFRSPDQIAHRPATRDIGRRPHAMRVRIAVALGRTRAFPVSARRSGNKIVRRNAEGGYPLRLYSGGG
jgi:hypothetical protein